MGIGSFFLDWLNGNEALVGLGQEAWRPSGWSALKTVAGVLWLRLGCLVDLLSMMPHTSSGQRCGTKCGKTEGFSVVSPPCGLCIAPPQA